MHAMHVHIDLASVYVTMCYIGMRNIWDEKIGPVRYDIFEELHIITTGVGCANSATN